MTPIELAAITAASRVASIIPSLCLAQSNGGSAHRLRECAAALQEAADSCFAALPEEIAPEATAAAPCHLRPDIEAHPAAQLAHERTPVREAVHRIEQRTGRKLTGPVTSLPADLRAAVKLLARQLLAMRSK